MTDPDLAALAFSPWVLLLFFAWGFAEAVAAPIVPDVGLCFLALATPAALGSPIASAIAGGVVGALALARFRARRPDVVDRILALQPGLGAAGMAEARERIARRDGRAFAQLGPGLPLKAYVVAWIHDRPRSGAATLAGLALLNRLTRILPVVAAFALVGLLARPLDVPVAPVVLVYAIGWTVFYAAFWWRRRSRGGRYVAL